MTAAAEAVVAISRRLRPAMLELMDRASINAVEDFLSMGLDRSAGALLVAQSDAGGRARGRDRRDGRGLRAGRRRRGVQHRRPGRGRGVRGGPAGGLPGDREAGLADARGRRGSGAALPALLAGIEPIAGRNDVEIPPVAHAGDGNTHPIVVYDAADPDSVRPGRQRSARS